MRFMVVAFLGVLGLAFACGPTSHRHDDDWGEKGLLEAEITGDNDTDEERWRRELASDPWGDDAGLLTDDPPRTAAEYGK